MRNNLIFNSLLNAYTLYDYDNNGYTTVTIGGQEWIAQNLKTTHYADGISIQRIDSSTLWTTDSSGAYCWYDNNISYKNPYGALYNWYTINHQIQYDWFLPSIAEVSIMYTNLKAHGVGGFQDDLYWSSTELGATSVSLMNFANGAGGSSTKDSLQCVRACRSFSSSSVYPLRSIGPTGGFIFYDINNGDGTYTYYEASATDQSTNNAWSNIIDTAVPVNSSGIGSGKGNTAAIVNQVGHTSSSAKLARDITNVLANLVYFKRNGVRETGWKVPSDEDFTTLSNFLGGDAIAGGKLKEIGTSHWATATGATDEVGFKGLAAGYRHNITGAFSALLNQMNFWSTTNDDIPATTARDRGTQHSSTTFTNNMINYVKSGLSIRCLRDTQGIPILSFTTDTSIFDPTFSTSTGILKFNLGDVSYNVDSNNIYHSYPISGNKNVKVFSGTTNGSSAITGINMVSDSLVGTLDISSLINLNSLNVTTNSLLTRIVNPISTTTFNTYMAAYCGLSGIFDVSSLSSLGGDFIVNNNTSLTSILNPSSNKVFTQYYAFNCNLTGTLDLRKLTGLGGDFQVHTNANLTQILNPNTSRSFSNYLAFSCNLTGTLDLSSLVSFPQTFMVTYNRNLTNIINPNSSTSITLYRVDDCSLSGTLDVSGLTNFPRYFYTNGNSKLSRILFPPTLAPITINVKNCSLGTSNIDEIFAKTYAYYNANVPQANIDINTSGGKNMPPTNGSSNVNIVNIIRIFDSSTIYDASIIINYT